MRERGGLLKGDLTAGGARPTYPTRILFRLKWTAAVCARMNVNAVPLFLVLSELQPRYIEKREDPVSCTISREMKEVH